MLSDHRMEKLVDYPQLYDVFPGVKIRGGVSYWLWSRDYDGPCEVQTMIGEEPQGKPERRFLDAHDVLIRRNEAVHILDKVLEHEAHQGQNARLSDQVSARRPFGLTNQVGTDSADSIIEPVSIFGNQKTGYISRNEIKHNAQWVDRWKVLSVKAHGTSGRDDLTILGKPLIAPPGSACTETYLVIGACDSEEEARNLARYLSTRLVRFLVSLRKITHNITRDSYKFVPLLPMDRGWSDEELYERYGISEEEVAFVEERIVARPGDEGEVEVDV